MLKKMKRG